MARKSQLPAYLRTLGLRYMSLSENQDDQTLLKREINYPTCLETAVTDEAISGCFEPAEFADLKISAEKLFELLNQRKSKHGDYIFNQDKLGGGNNNADFNPYAYWPLDISSMSVLANSLMIDPLNANNIGLVGKGPELRGVRMANNERPFTGESKSITKDDLKRLVRWGIEKRARDLTPREKQKVESDPENNPLPLTGQESRLLFHRMCYALTQVYFSDNYFARPVTQKWFRTNDSVENANNEILRLLEQECHIATDKLYSPPPKDIESYTVYPPVVFERKVRVYETSGRYVYRGGKSLNLNIQASFSFDNSRSFQNNRQVGWSPINFVKDTFNTIVGTFGLSSSFTFSHQDSIRKSNGAGVASGTFLVGQESSFTVELSKYERCLVARFHPKLLSSVFRQQEKRWLKPGFNQDTDEDINGFMFCEGKVIEENLPVNERYYYFTQHFTEGDMLDTADLHNHPWLLQLRGERDFQAFTAGVGALEVNYIDDTTLQATAKSGQTDMGFMEMVSRQSSNVKHSMKILDQDEDVRWPLESLGETYFNTLPTFPGLYTFPKSEGGPDWPYKSSDPAEAIQ